MQNPFPNPESAWHAEHHIADVDEDAVRSRLKIGNASITRLSGGLANDNYQIGSDRVLRIYRRDADSLPLEATLLSRPWQQLRTPRILDRGADFLVLEFVGHRVLHNTYDDGLAIGTALCEIHHQTFDTSGLLSSNAQLQESWPDFAATTSHYLHDGLAESRHSDLLKDAAGYFTSHREDLREVMSTSVLLHGDFKASNLHLTECGLPLVLDWEFAYSGPPIMDVSQLFRWAQPSSFIAGFEAGYRERHESLPDDWLDLIAVADLVNMVGLLRKSEPGSRREEDCRNHLKNLMKKP